MTTDTEEERTHWDGCHTAHLDCAILKIVTLEAERDEADNDKLRAIGLCDVVIAERDALREDAERYRWLLDNRHIRCLDDRRYYYEPYAKGICDAAIDKARKP